jgi:hypothetical protein
MMKSLPRLSILAACVWASVAMATPAAVPVSSRSGSEPSADAVAEVPAHVPTGDTLLRQASDQLERRATISARLRHQISVSGQDLYGVGTYWQQGSGDELKVRLELQIAGQPAKLLQVSNSRFLWIDRQLPTGRTVVRYDLRQLRADPALTPPGFDKLDPGKANWSPIQPLLTAHSGGLPSLLAALAENFSFLPPQAMRLAIEPAGGGHAATIPVFAVVGHWKEPKLAALLSKTGDPATDDQQPRKSKPIKFDSLPERLPQEVLLLVGQDDLFPYRIEYRKLETPTIANASETGGRAGEDQQVGVIPYQLSVHPLVVVEFSDVVFDAPVAAGQFDYTPGDPNWLDQTATLLERLRRERQTQVATRAPDQPALPTR